MDQAQQDWYDKATLFTDSYDNVCIKKQAFVIEEAWRAVQLVYDSLSIEDRKLVEGLMSEMSEKFKKWDQHRDMLGKRAYEKELELKAAGKDISAQQLSKERKFSFDQFFHALRKFGKILRAAKLSQGHAPVEPSLIERVPVLPALVRGVKNSTYSLLGAGWWLTRKAFYHLLFGGVETYEAVARFSGKKTPVVNFTMLVSQHFLPMGRDPRFKNVKVSGQEHLKFDDNLNLFANVHRQDYGDLLLLPNLNLPNMHLFIKGSAVGEMFASSFGFAGEGDFIGRRIVKRDDFINVARFKDEEGVDEHGNPKPKSSPDPLVKIREILLDPGHSKNIVNYLQGFIASLHEILNPTPHAASGLICPLANPNVKDGIEPEPVRLNITAYEVESDFLGGGGESRKHLPFEVKSLKPLEPHVVRYICAQEMKRDEHNHQPHDQLLEMFIRISWMTAIKNFGELSLEEVASRIQANIGVDILEGLRD